MKELGGKVIEIGYIPQTDFDQPRFDLVREPKQEAITLTGQSDNRSNGGEPVSSLKDSKGR